jgi:uncharacterized protein (TIGR03546 family)
MLRALAKILKVLNSESEPSQISLALSLALITGFTPLWSLHNVIVVLLALVIRVNLSTFIVTTVILSGVAYLLDPMFSWIGLAVLTAGPLESFWTALYNIPLFRLAKFNNSIVMGSLVVSLALFLPSFILANVAIVRYREHVLQWVRKSRVMEALTASRFYSLYESVSGWRR